MKHVLPALQAHCWFSPAIGGGDDPAGSRALPPPLAFRPQASPGRMLHEAILPWQRPCSSPPSHCHLRRPRVHNPPRLGLYHRGTQNPPVPIRQPPTEVIVFAMAVAAVAQPVGLFTLASANLPPPRTPLRLATHVPVYNSIRHGLRQASRDVLDGGGRLLRPDERELVPHRRARDDFHRRIRYSITLRSGLHFHDGTALEAIDVKRSLERTLHPKTPCPVASLYSAIEGYDAYRKGADDNLLALLSRSIAGTILMSRPDAFLLRH